jgi:iron complex transport system substrate-binding protein
VLRRTIAGTIVLAALAVLAPSATARPSAGPSFPVTVDAANGKVTITSRPQRIVSLSPTATEDLFAVGAGPQVIAVDDQSNYPAKAPKTKLSGFTPNAEAVAAYKPDLVVISNDANGLLKALGKLHIPALLEPAAATLTDTYKQIEQLGWATGHAPAARALTKKMRAQIGSIVASVPKPAKRLTVYHELGPDYYSVTSKTFVGQVYKLLGLRDIADAADKSGSGYPQLSGEFVVGANPDLIVLADTKCCHQTAGTVARRPGWETVSAVKHGGVLGVSDDVASRWGPRIVDLFGVVAAKVRALVKSGSG